MINKFVQEHVPLSNNLLLTLGGFLEVLIPKRKTEPINVEYVSS